MVPGFEIPRLQNQSDRDLIRWTSLVYYLAWATDAPYLDVELECCRHLGKISFFYSWAECPQPPDCLPFPWLIHQGMAGSRIEKTKKRFEDYGEEFPPFVDAYLTGEFVLSSLAAIDILVYKLNSERRQKAVDSTEYAKKLKPTVAKYSNSKANLGRLAMTLHAWHQPGRARKHAWLTQEEIAEKAQILTKETRKPATSTVSRLMEIIFGPNPSKTYHNLAEANDRGQKLRSILERAKDEFEKYYLGDDFDN